MSDEAAYVLFPGDRPPSKPPAYVEAQHAAASQRLLGNHGRQEGQDEAARQAHAMFPNERKADDQPSAGDPDDPAAALFPKDVVKPDAAMREAIGERLEGYAHNAMAEGDHERASELRAATDALSADFAKAGASADDAREAFELMHEGMSRFAAPTPEEADAALTAGLEVLMAEYDDDNAMMADIRAAQALIRDLEIIAPGTMASLEHTGMGSDPRMVRKAIAEAKRRGYR